MRATLTLVGGAHLTSPCRKHKTGSIALVKQPKEGRAEDQLEACDGCTNTSTSVSREVAGRRRASDLSYSLLDTDTPPN